MHHQYVFTTNRFIVGIAALLAASLALFIPSQPFLALLPLCVLGIAVLAILPLPATAAVALVLSAGLYRGFFLSLRLPISGIPIGLYDVLWGSLLIGLLAKPFRPQLRSNSGLLLALMAAAVYVGVLGILFHQPLDNIIRAGRAQLLLPLGVAVALSLSPKGQMLSLRALVWGAVLTGLSQWATFLFASRGINIWARLHVATFDTRETIVADVATLSGFRDNSVMINFCVIGALIVLSGRFAREPQFLQVRYTLALATCVSAILLSLTRTSWLALAAGLLSLLILIRHSQGRSLLIGPILKMSLAGGLLLVLLLAFGPLTTPGQAVLERLASIRGGKQNSTLTSRWDEAAAALQATGIFTISGTGAQVAEIESKPFPSSPVTVITPKPQLHIGYVNLLTVGGPLVLGIVLALFYKTLRAAWQGAKNTELSQSLFIASSSFSGVVAFALTATAGGVLLDGFYTGVLGFLCGAALSLTCNHNPSSPTRRGRTQK